jgi:glycosyltransferase involved in cell wall biosynthesis
VHRKHPASLRQVRPLRRCLLELAPDIVHVRSRLPAWLVFLALGRRPRVQRPAIVSTFHGLYSVNRYSAVMGRADAVIAISACVRDYILANYPAIPGERIEVIHRGVDVEAFPRGFRPDPAWSRAFLDAHPRLGDVPLVLMPGRLSRWKGQEAFIALVAQLRARGVACHGVIVGGPTPGKEGYARELGAQVAERGLQDAITFLGHRDDMAELYAVAAVVCNLSQHPEPFGRTVIEALAIGTPVAAFAVGGPAESLRDCLPDGLAPPGDLDGLADRVARLITDPPAFELPREFTLAEQAARTLDLYRRVLAGPIGEPPRTGRDTAGR